MLTKIFRHTALEIEIDAASLVALSRSMMSKGRAQQAVSMLVESLMAILSSLHPRTDHSMIFSLSATSFLHCPSWGWMCLTLRPH